MLHQSYSTKDTVWSKDKWVIGSKTDFDENGVPHFKGYGLIRTRVMTAQEYNERKKNKE